MKTLIVNHEPTHFHSIEQEILFSYPQLNILGYASCCKDAAQMIEQEQPKLVIMDLDLPKGNAFKVLNDTAYSNFETIFIAQSSTKAIEAIKYQASGYILKPLKAEELLSAIKVAAGKINLENNQQKKKFPEHIISIPTMQGLEFIEIKDIIRCEGLHRCTRVIMKGGLKITSSYNIGTFKKRLLPYYFCSPHKSHLINLHHIKSYLKEGRIKMADGGFVPISKRRKGDFIKLLSPSLLIPSDSR